MNKTRKPNSSELAQAIERLRAEVATLDAEHDQAEAKCRDSAHDDSLYQAARHAADSVKVKRDDMARRLEALQEARECAIDAELENECERLRSEVVKAGQNYKTTAPQMEERRKAAQAECDRAMKEVADGLDRLRREMQLAERAWKDAEARRRERFERRHPDKAEAAREQARQRQQRIEANAEIRARVDGLWYEGFDSGQFHVPPREGSQAEYARSELEKLVAENPVAAERLRQLKREAATLAKRKQQIEERGPVVAVGP